MTETLSEKLSKPPKANIHKALFEFSKEMKPVKKDVDNNFFKSKYADLEAVVEAAKKLMEKNKLLARHETYFDKEIGTILRTIIIHVDSGETIESEILLPTKDHSPQQYGSAITYMRRYSLCLMLGIIVSDEDDDGNDASGNNAEASQPYSAPKRSAPRPRPRPQGGQ